jgi:ferredoxin
MKPSIYWFSGTGNSLTLARDLYSVMDSELRSIRNGVHPTDKAGLECCVLVFPVYHATFGESGIPRPVSTFISRHLDLPSTRFYALVTHDGFPGFTIRSLDRMLRSGGGRLSAGFTVRAGVPFAPGEKIRYVMGRGELVVDEERDRERREALRAQWRERLPAIARLISAGETGALEGTGPIAARLLKPWLALQKAMALARYRKLSGSDSSGRDGFEDLVCRSDRAFVVSEACAGCAACSRVCPVGNITLVEGRPVWSGHCENCFACFQWCPQEAISGELVEFQKRWRWPGLSAKDFFAGSG